MRKNKNTQLKTSFSPKFKSFRATHSPFPKLKGLKIIGLTGGIASGKSTVAKILRRKGLPVIDTDAVAHAVIQKNQPAYFKTIKIFGKEIVRKNGEINRKKLGQIIFASSSLRKQLEAIIHPAVQKQIAIWLRKQHKQKHKTAVLEVPLLFEAGWDKFCDETWLVYTTKAQQIDRLKKRDGLKNNEAKQRLRAQWPIGLKKNRATRIFYNDKNLSDFKKYIIKSIF